MLYFIGAFILVNLIAGSCVVYLPLISGIVNENRIDRRLKKQTSILMSIGLIISASLHGSFLYYAIFKDHPFMWFML